jgi:tetratricopeptide (TPR) repeat protein
MKQRKISGTVFRMLGVASIPFFFACAAAVAVPRPQTGHEAHAHAGPVPQEILDRAVPLRMGIGSLHEKVSTSSPEAQAFYDQGLAYLHSYVWIEAVRSFHQALRADANLGMAFLGLTDAYIGLQDVANARAACQRAKALEQRMSKREQGWLTIRDRELDFLEDGSDPEKYVAYRRAVNDELRRNPSDPWLWIQRGLADEGSPSIHGQSGGMDTLAFYKMALSFAPDNFAAHHFCAHTYENLGRTKEALEESEIYVRLASAIPHAHHMHGHELLQSGRTEEAIREFLQTKELEDNYYRTENIPARYDWHHTHNLQLLALSYQSLGQMKSAEAMFREAFASSGYTEFLDYNRRVWPEFLLDRGRFQEALEAARDLQKSEWPMTRLAGHTLAGQALLAMNRTSEAQEEEARADRETEATPVAAIAALPYPGVLRAGILLQEKQTAKAEALLKEIEQNIRATPGPDAWSAALLELGSIARSARESSDWELAEFTAGEMIAHAPNCAAGYFALGLVARHRGDAAGAQQQFARAEKLWNSADKDLPELERIHQTSAAP